MWEVVTDCSLKPWDGYTSAQMIKKLLSGVRLSVEHINCPEKIKKLIKQCTFFFSSRFEVEVYAWSSMFST